MGEVFGVHEATKAPRPAEALQRIADLYSVEQEPSGRPPDGRHSVRRCRFFPSSRFGFDGQIGHLPPSWRRPWPTPGSAATACPAMSRTAAYPSTAVLVSPSCAPRFGRRNWLFAGSAKHGERATIIYSVAEICRLNGIDPLP